jgi:quinohemoprotein ethanol dehydrogenase
MTSFGAASIAVTLLLCACAQTASTMGRTSAIGRAPAFSASDLDAAPTDNWITNGGSLSNQRYSPLTEITTSNVNELKGVWLTHLRGSATAAKYSAEAQPLEYQGVIYVATGADDVFAVSVDTGKILWEYQAHLDQSISVVCCGWSSRGVALGDGKVFVGQIDDKLVALDQTTGREAWSTLVDRWQNGYSITSAPLYVDGLVITGVSGAENGVRGHLTAYDASNGKEVWRFYTIPGPGEMGSGTWPATGDAWQHGGATVWQTPSVDPKLGLIYFSTANAGRNNDGSDRAGKNLFSASMVALDVKTGKLRWYYQMVHHDIWDYDATSPTVLFDATINGKLVQGIGEAEKTGWLYLLDRTNGQPIFPIPERPVPQNAQQKTWPTQPIPDLPQVVPHVPSRKQVQFISKLAALDTGHPVQLIVATKMFTPYWKTMTLITPGPQGGTNWQPSSYNPNTHMFYVCAESGVTGDTADVVKPEERKPGEVEPVEYGSQITHGDFARGAGTFSAIDVTSGKIVWQLHWPESCYSGSVTTAGNLVFVGRNGGLLQAYDARNGRLLWSFQTGAGANNVATIFQHSGREYVAFYAGGNGLAATPHGDNLWLLGLDGTLAQAAAPGPGQGIVHAGTALQMDTHLAAGNPAAGASVFAANCAVCHGAKGLGGSGGPNLTAIPSAKDLRTVLRQVTNGGAGMPAFQGMLNQQEIANVAAFVVKDITHGK